MAACEPLALRQELIQVATPSGWVLAAAQPLRLGGIKHALDTAAKARTIAPRPWRPGGPAQAMADNSRHRRDSTTVRGHVSAAGAKGGLANKLLAVRGAASL